MASMSASALTPASTSTPASSLCVGSRKSSGGVARLVGLLGVSLVAWLPLRQRRDASLLLTLALALAMPRRRRRRSRRYVFAVRFLAVARLLFTVWSALVSRVFRVFIFAFLIVIAVVVVVVVVGVLVIVALVAFLANNAFNCTKRCPIYDDMI